MSNLYCLEYSPSQKAFHIDELRHIMEGNLNAFIDKKLNDYVIIFIGTENQCDVMAKKTEKYRY